MRPPEVYKAISAVTLEVAKVGLPKRNFNLQDDYFYRSIEDVMECLAPLIAKHGLCVLPRVLKRSAVERSDKSHTVFTHVALKVAFDLVSTEDGSRHTVQAFGEALDDADKATAKAMSGAYKLAMLQVFCIPVVGAEDSDCKPSSLRKSHDPEPVQGWEQWSNDLIEMIRGCESNEALDRVQDSNRALLKAIQRERRETYQKIGGEFAVRRTGLPTHSELGSGTRPIKRVRIPGTKGASAKDHELA